MKSWVGCSLFAEHPDFEKRSPALVIVKKAEPPPKPKAKLCSKSSAVYGLHRVFKEREKLVARGCPTITYVDSSPKRGEFRVMSDFKDFIREEMMPFEE